MEILLVGSDYFKPWLIKAGAKVRHLGWEKDSEIHTDPNRVNLQALVSGLEKKPDLLLLTDDLGSRVLPFGLDRVSVPKVYYGVDSPINFYWQKHLAGVFDLVFLDQRDQARQLSTQLDQEILWLPVGVDTLLYVGPPEEQAYDFAFVGTVEHNVRPKRSAILKLLSNRYSIKQAGGRGEGWVSPQDAGRLYRRSRLVLNENLFPGVTTRMLEVMASGGCLFSEDVDNGLKDLFQPGVHYIAFDHSSILDLADQYLNNPKAREAMAQKGRALAKAEHTIQSRANRLLGFCQGLESRISKPDSRALGWTFLLLGIRWPGLEGQRRIIKAGLMFKEHLRRNSNSAGALLGLALALAAANRFEEALGYLEQFEITPDTDLSLPLARAYLLHQLRREKEAFSWFNLAADLAGTKEKSGQGRFGPDLAPGQAEFHYQWGLVLTKAGNGLWPGFNRLNLPMMFWGGAEHLQQAVRIDPQHKKAFQALAGIMDQEGQYAFSHLLWKRALDLDPGDRENRNSYRLATQRAYLGGRA